MSSSNASYLLHNFLFQLRTPLYSIKSAWQLAKQWKEKIPANIIDWLEKWMPAVEQWVSSEEKAHMFLEDGEIHDWEQIVYEMANDMKDISVAFAEGQALNISGLPECESINKLALDGGFKYLTGIIQPILGRDFHHLLQ